MLASLLQLSISAWLHWLRHKWYFFPCKQNLTVIRLSAAQMVKDIQTATLVALTLAQAMSIAVGMKLIFYALVAVIGSKFSCVKIL